MSGDWIRMRISLADHPRTRRAAELLLDDPRLAAWAPLRDMEDRDAALRVTRYVCVTAMLKFWGYANEHAKGDHIDFLVTRDIDEITGVPGFGDALAAAGWVLPETGGGLRLPDFSSHNTSAEVRKSSAAERQKAYRQRKKLRDADGDVTRDVTSHAREEKRRGDIGNTEPSGSVPARKSRGAKRCPADFEITAEMRSWAQANAARADVDRETLKFRNHEFAKARSDWLATWQNWLLKADDDAPTSRVTSRVAPHNESFRERDAREAEAKVAFLTGRKPTSPQGDFIEAEVTDVTPRRLG